MTYLKRSFIDEKIEQAIDLIKRRGYPVPEFFFWTKEDWKTKSREYQEIVDTDMGWDITDFGSGDFNRRGLLLFNVRNGRQGDVRYPKVYAERICFTLPGQDNPPHWHKSKMEDLINYGDSPLYMQLFNVDPEGQMDTESDVLVQLSGRRFKIKAGEAVEIRPGQSLTLTPGIIHQGVAGPDSQPADGMGFLIEISSVTNDTGDNIYLDDKTQWPVEVIEDIGAKYCRVREYPVLL